MTVKLQELAIKANLGLLRYLQTVAIVKSEVIVAIYVLLFGYLIATITSLFTIATVCKYHNSPKLAFMPILASSCNLTVIREYCLMSVAIL